VLVGPHSEYFVIDTAGQQNVLGVHFRPGGAFPFFGLPADELHGQHVSLRELWGGFARQLREQLLAARTPEARLDLAEMALLRQMRTPSPHPAVRYALGEFQGPRRVRDVCAATGLSARRFIELFRREVGMAPKQYCRVRRFQRVVQSAGMAAVDWSAVALEAGYCDQSHLIHEFREISGLSPSAWAGLRTGHRNHVPIPG
jgi:AraC-like DNA-binding protein